MGLSQEEGPVPSIVRPDIALGPVRRDLIPLYQRWFNDLGTLRTQGMMNPMSVEQTKAWYEDQAKAERHITLTVYASQGVVPIGITGLDKIDHWNQAAEFFLNERQAVRRSLYGLFEVRVHELPTRAGARAGRTPVIIPYNH